MRFGVWGVGNFTSTFRESIKSFIDPGKFFNVSGKLFIVIQYGF
jgi:hypothetical protein